MFDGVCFQFSQVLAVFLVITTPSGRPPIISTSLNQYYSWPVINLVVSAGVFHISLRPQKTQQRGWKFQAQEREFCGTLYSPCICRLSPACILRETSTKATSHADISRWLTRPLCRSSGLYSRLSDFCWLRSLPFLLMPTSADYCQLLSPSFFTNRPSVLSGTFLSSSTSGFAGDLVLKAFVWVSRQNKQRDRTHTHTQPNAHIVSHFPQGFHFGMTHFQFKIPFSYPDCIV